MFKLSGFLIGFGFSIIGFIYIITYLNYLSIGFTLKEYLKLIFTRGECLLAFIGLLILFIVIYSER